MIAITLTCEIKGTILFIYLSLMFEDRVNSMGSSLKCLNGKK